MLRSFAVSITAGGSLFVIHLALGGCLRSSPVRYGITADTGGHIAYILNAAEAQAARDDVRAVSIVTRLFVDPAGDEVHVRPVEAVTAKLTINRIGTANTAYLQKEDLCAEIPALIEAFCTHLASLPIVPDVIHAHFADAAIIAIEARRRFGIPVVYTPHSLAIDKGRLGLADTALCARIEDETSAIARSDAIIVSTQDEADRQIAAYGVPTGGRVHRVRPGVPRPDSRHPDETQADHLPCRFDRPDLPIILAIARPVRKKNLPALLRAFAASDRLRESANLVILAGQHAHATGEEREVLDELRRLAAQPELRGKVALPPSHCSRDVAALYAMAARGGVFVNPALHEPFGLTLIEAAAAGVPVVATRNGGPVEIVGTLDNGILVDPTDTAALAEACLALLADPQAHRRHALAGRRGIASYSWSAYAEASTRIYRACSKPQLLVCDIDNTLTGCREGALAFRDWARQRSMPFVIATGRPFADARRILAAWSLPQPDAYIVDVGSCIMMPGEHGEWQSCPHFAKNLDTGWDLPAIAHALRPLALEAQPDGVQTRHKLSFFGDAAAAGMIRATLAAADIPAKIIHSHETLIDVLPLQGGKAGAIAAYAARLSLPISACIAAGDSGNDADMLAQCGFAVIVGNADADLADLPMRPGMYRARNAHAAGVLEGLEAHGVAPVTMPVAA